MGYSEALFTLVDAIESAGPYVAGAGAAAAGGAAATGALGAGAGTSSSATGATSAGASSPETASAAPGGESAPKSSSFFGSGVKSAVAGSATSAAINALFGPKNRFSVPPPPGAAMIDPEGAQAAAMSRQRQAVAGGLSSTVTGAGANPAAYSVVTSGGKSLLGQ